MNFGRAPCIISRTFRLLGNAQLVSGSTWGRFPSTSVIMARRTGKIRGYSDFCRERNRLRVLLDMDMVLADFEEHFLTKYRETYPDAPYVKAEDRDGFWLRDQYEKISPNLKDKVQSIYEAEFFFRDLPEIPGAIEAAQEINKMEDVDVFICTSPLVQYKYCVKEKFEWVEQHLGMEWVEKLIITRDKTMVQGHVLIDDKPKIKGKVICCLSIPSWKHVVFTACHNRRTNIHGRRRLDNWTDGSWRNLLEDIRKHI
ncbi:5'(3')-deoxyribonucleotidase, cytosolic type-like [Liolophura sinensis]|uniref:5'(3')-deoxyribonucleotidase, cytosolic type-like n=1 Tax=Liolophura sinensis TaxID=3198878 RepID=UPI003159022B